VNEKDLESRLRKNQHLSKRQAEKLLDEIIQSIKDELKLGHRVRLRNFGTFSLRNYQAKIIQDIHGKVRTLPDKKKVFFKQSKNIFNTR
jgi:DNA-binding protein HU-beta